MDGDVAASVVCNIRGEHIGRRCRFDCMHYSARRKLGEKDAVIPDIGAAINVRPIGLRILYKPFLGLQLAIGVVPLKAFVKGGKLYIGPSGDFRCRNFWHVTHSLFGKKLAGGMLCGDTSPNLVIHKDCVSPGKYPHFAYLWLHETYKMISSGQ